MKILLLAYICWSLTFGGIAATVAIWYKPEIPSWNKSFRDVVISGLVVTIAWPYILLAMLLDKDPS